MTSLLGKAILEMRVLAGRNQVLESETSLPAYARTLKSLYLLLQPGVPIERLDLWLTNCDPEMMVDTISSNASWKPSYKLLILDTVCALLPKDSALFLHLDEPRSSWKSELETKRNENECSDARLKSWEELKQLRDTKAHTVICNPLVSRKRHMDALVFATYCSINVPRLDLGNVKNGFVVGQSCVWKEDGHWKLQITKWNKVKHNGTRVQTFDSIMGHLLDISFKNIPRKFLFQTSKGLPYKKDYLCEALRKYNTNNRLLRYACSTHTWANSELTYASRDEICRNMNHSIQVSLRSYNKPELNNSKRPKFENPIIEN